MTREAQVGIVIILLSREGSVDIGVSHYIKVFCTQFSSLVSQSSPGGQLGVLSADNSSGPPTQSGGSPWGHAY